jgi:hypothetical protein
MPQRHRRRPVAWAALALMTAMLAPSVSSAAVECRGTVRGEYRGKETRGDVVEHTFLADISSDAECGKVYFDLVVTERLFNGEEITLTRRDWRKTNRGVTSAYKISHRTAKDSDLVRWEFRVNTCVVCGTE